MNNLLNDFLKYVSYDTISDPTSGLHPSTEHQFALAKVLLMQLKELGCSDCFLSDKCYCYATILENCPNFPTIGLMAHMDTAPDMSGKDVKPRIIYNYDGEDIVLNEELNIVMRSDEFPSLKERIGETIIVTDGTTLLGADDKAGIAIIMDIIRTLNNNPDLKHGKIKICFTPDEEIGEGADNVDLERFACDFAFTYDGDLENVINCENFNAASAFVTIHGANIHPGSAKGKMKNSIMIANEFDSLLSPVARPQFTEKYEGLYSATLDCTPYDENPGYITVCHLVSDDPADGIANVHSPSSSVQQFYDLQGRKLNSPISKGLYIVNGRIVVVK